MRLSTTIFLLTVSFALYSQDKYDANWCFGYEGGINFSDTTNPIAFRSKTNNVETTTSISDKSGNLLFYITYLTPLGGNSESYYDILNSNNQVITNGDSIAIGNSATNGALILPAPGFQNKFYLFHLAMKPCYECHSLYYSIIEIDSAGILSVTIKNQLLKPNVQEKLAAVKHANGKDWWLFAHEKYVNACTNRFYKFLLSENGIHEEPFQDIGTYHCGFYYSNLGEMKFSAKGDKLAVVVYSSAKTDLFDFDRCSGELYFLKTITGSAFSCEFSHKGLFLYILGNVTSYTPTLYQYEITDTNSSGIEIWNPNNAISYQIERAANNKIYLASLYPTSFEKQHLGVINSPDSLGLSCDFQPFSFFIGDSSYAAQGLPNFPNYNLGPINIYSADAGDDTLLICSDQTSNVILGTPQVEHILYSWSPSHGLSDTTIAQPTASPTISTWYYLTVTDTTYSSCISSRTDSIFVKVDSCITRISKPEQSAIRVYPNPTTDNLTIEGLKRKAMFQLYDLYGREVLTTQLVNGTNKVETKNLANGIYIYRVTGESKVGKVFIEK